MLDIPEVLTPFTDFEIALEEAQYQCIKDGVTVFIVEGVRWIAGTQVMHICREEDVEDFPRVLHVERPAKVKPKRHKHEVNGIPLHIYCKTHETPVSYENTLRRIASGMSVEEAVTRPSVTAKRPDSIRQMKLEAKRQKAVSAAAQ